MRFKPTLVPDHIETRTGRNSFPLGFCFVLRLDSIRQLLQNPNKYIITTDSLTMMSGSRSKLLTARLLAQLP